jgi:hypothetical protein
MFMMFLITSIATLRERTSGTLDRLMTEPISKLDFIFGYAIAFTILGILQAAIASAAILGRLSRMNPRSGYTGTLDKIEVFYHGEKSDMTPSLKALADKSDKLLVDSAKAAEEPVVTGRVSGDYRVKGKNLQLDSAEIKFYITVTNSAGPGDKTVFANQLKSTVGETMGYTMHTESGIPIDAVFGGRSVIKRIVNSHGIEGSTATLLWLMDKKSVELFES